MNLIRKSFPFALCVLLQTGCNDAHAPSRPEEVPNSAVWTGGSGWGAFVDCSPSNNAEPNHCTVYDDRTGRVYQSGRFVVERTRRGVTADRLRYDGAPDGMRIFLKERVALIPLSPERPSAVPGTASLGENGVYADCHAGDNNLYTCSLYLAATGEHLFSGSYRCASLPAIHCADQPKYANRDEISLRNAGLLKVVR